MLPIRYGHWWMNKAMYMTQICLMGTLLKDNFGQLFTASASRQSYPHLQYLNTKVSDANNEMLMRPYKENEVFAALQSIGSIKSSRLDGFQPLFYKRFWHLLKPHVMKLVTTFRETGTFA